MIDRIISSATLQEKCYNTPALFEFLFSHFWNQWQIKIRNESYDNEGFVINVAFKSWWPRSGPIQHSHLECGGRGVARFSILNSNAVAAEWQSQILHTCSRTDRAHTGHRAQIGHRLETQIRHTDKHRYGAQINTDTAHRSNTDKHRPDTKPRYAQMKPR